jgi:hypothetical protein
MEWRNEELVLGSRRKQAKVNRENILQGSGKFLSAARATEAARRTFNEAK